MKKTKKNSNKNVSFAWAFKHIIWPRRSTIGIGLLLIIFSRLASLVLPGASKYLMDDVIVNKDIEMLKLVLIVVLVAIIVQATTSFLLTRILSVEAQHLIAKFRARVQKKVLSLPISFFDNNKSGALVSRIMTDVTGVRNLVGTGLVQFVGGSFTAIISLILLIRINLTMTVFVLVPVSIFAFIALKAFGYIRPIFRSRGKINAEVTGRLTETLNGVRVIKGFNAEQQENLNFEEGVERLYENVKKSLTSTAFVTSSATFLLGLATTGIMGIGGYLMIQDQMTFGEFLSFTLYLGLMISPIVQMSNIGSQLTEALAGLDRTEEIMKMTEENNPEERTIKLNNLKGAIVFDDVHFSYEQSKEVLHGISFEAQPGSVTALVGSSGSGKSTIASLAASFLSPSSGQVLIDDENLKQVELDSFRRHLGVVLQDDFLFEGSIRDNILFPHRIPILFGIGIVTLQSLAVHSLAH